MQSEYIYAQLIEQHQSTFQRYKPYVYIWTNIITLQSYLGVRHAKGCDYLTDTYICSQKHTKDLIKANPEQWKRTILKTFETIEEALMWEHFYLDIVDAKNQESMNNKINGGKAFGFDWTGKKHTEKTRKKMSESLKQLYANGFVNPNFGRTGEKHPNFGKTGDKNPKSKKYKITKPDGTIEIIIGLRHFCRNNNLKPESMTQIAQGKFKHHKGFKCEYFIG